MPFTSNGRRTSRRSLQSSKRPLFWILCIALGLFLVRNRTKSSGHLRNERIDRNEEYKHCSPRTAYSSGCILNEEGAVVPSPYAAELPLEPIHQDPSPLCVDAPPPASPPPKYHSLVNEQSPCEDRVRAFQSFTARGFTHWYPWDGSVDQKERTLDPPEMRGYLDESSVYRLKHFCVSPLGRLVGMNPKVEPFPGGDDVETITQDRSTFQRFRDWLEHPEEMSSSDSWHRELPRCTVKQKLLILPVLTRSDNPGHCFQRMAALLDIRSKAFPNASPAEVTTMFVHSEGDWDKALNPRTVNAFKDYLTAVTFSHFSVWAHGRKDLLSKGRFFSSAELDHPAMTLPLCFEEAAIYFTCTHEECTAARDMDGPPLARPIYPLYYRRSKSIQENFVQRLRQCGQVESRPQPERGRPLVLLAHRSYDRRWTMAPDIIPRLGAYVEKALNGRFKVSEMRGLTPVQLMKQYAVADIVISPYGAGLFYSLFMPPGAVAIEVSFELFKCSYESGINRKANLYCDYGGNFDAAGIHHIVAMTKHVSEREMSRGAVEHDVSHEVLTSTLRSGFCLLQNVVQPPDDGSNYGCTRGLNQSNLDLLQLDYQSNSDGSTLEKLLAIKSYSIFDAVRLQQVYKRHSWALAWALRSGRTVSNQPQPQPFRVLLSFDQCATSRLHRILSVVAEVAVIRAYVDRSVQLYLDSNTFNCPEKESHIAKVDAVVELFWAKEMFPFQTDRNEPLVILCGLDTPEQVTAKDDQSLVSRLPRQDCSRMTYDVVVGEASNREYA